MPELIERQTGVTPGNSVAWLVASLRKVLVGVTEHIEKVTCGGAELQAALGAVCWVCF